MQTCFISNFPLINSEVNGLGVKKICVLLCFLCFYVYVYFWICVCVCVCVFLRVFMCFVFLFCVVLRGGPDPQIVDLRIDRSENLSHSFLKVKVMNWCEKSLDSPLCSSYIYVIRWNDFLNNSYSYHLGRAASLLWGPTLELLKKLCKA